MERSSVLDGATIVVDRLHPGELPAAAEMLARSFVRERLFAYLFEGCAEPEVVRALVPWFRTWIAAYEAGGHIHTARRGGELVGVGIRIAPGGHVLSPTSEADFNAGLEESVHAMARACARAASIVDVGAAVERRQPPAPFWLLAWVGVAPEHQRCGVGAALANEAVRVIDADPAPAWLVTFGAHTRRLYEERGFVVEGEFAPLPDGPVGWTLLREGNQR